MESQEVQTYSSFLQENRKELSILLFLGALAGAFYYFFSLSQTSEISPLEEISVLDLYQITVNDYHMEHKKWELEGERAIISEKSHLMRIEQVKIWVYSKDNSSINISQKQSKDTNSISKKDVDLFIKADQGLIERDDNRITLSGNVILLHDNSSEVRTNTAIYDAQKDIITIPKPVRVLRDGYTMVGSGLTYLVSEGKLNLSNPVLLKYVGEIKRK